jgi:hypothetical protein
MLADDVLLESGTSCVRVSAQLAHELLAVGRIVHVWKFVNKNNF